MFLGAISGLFGLLAQGGAVCFWLYMAIYGFQHNEQDKGSGYIVICFALLMAAATAYCIYSQFKFVQEDVQFKKWLIANAEKISNNQLAFYRSQRITPDTILVRHHIVFSALIVSFRKQTRWIIKGQEPRAWHATAASLYTLCYGWWGFPFGFFWTPVAVFKNIAGSTCVAVRDLLQPAPAKPADFGERFQKGFSQRLQRGFFIDEAPAGILPIQPVKNI